MGRCGSWGGKAYFSKTTAESPRRAAAVAIIIFGRRDAVEVTLAACVAGIEKTAGKIGVAVEQTDGHSFCNSSGMALVRYDQPCPAAVVAIGCIRRRNAKLVALTTCAACVQEGA